MPCAAYGGREQLMRQVSPDGPVYQAGTLSGNPVAMAAGLATLELLGEPDAYDRLEATSAALEKGLNDAARQARCPARINRVGSMLTVFFTDQTVTDYAGATACDTQAFARFFGAMLDQGVVLPPSQFEAWFVSLAHDEQAIKQTADAAKKAFTAARSK
jgi:glutamate-1-semialdehyde 2,1-aminomutase